MNVFHSISSLTPRTRLYIFLSLVFIILAAGFFYWRYSPRPGTVTFTSGYDLVLKDYAGNDVRLSDYKRQILVVHAWASWCTYCAAEMTNLSALKDVYADKIQIIAVNRAEPLVEARPFSDKIQGGEKLVFLLDPTDSFYKSVQGYAMPETLFINDRGEILFHQHGPINIEEVKAKIDALLQ